MGSVSVETVRDRPARGMISAVLFKGSASVRPGVSVLLLALLLPEPSEQGSGDHRSDLAKFAANQVRR